MLPNTVFDAWTRAWLELYLLFVVLATAVFYPRLVTRLLDRSTRWIRALASRPRLVVAAAGLAAALSAAFAGLLVRFPEPLIHDEFSYLLAADTFSSGKLANAPHPLWRHFETYYVLQEPSYASQYPPGPGLMLALGQTLTGEPAVGIWLSAGLACAAIVWMLQAWVPAHWALVGGLIALTRFGFFGYWGQTYYVATVAVIGAALLFGAVRRLFERPSASVAVLMSLGLILLAISRPFEGFFVSLAPGIAVVGQIFFLSGPRRRGWLRQVLLPAALTLCVGGAWLALYNARVTSDPLTLPYQDYEKRYSYVPILLWQDLRPRPHYRHAVMAKFYDEQMLFQYRASRALFGRVKLWESFVYVVFLLGGAPLLLLLPPPWIWRSRWIWLATFSGAAGMAAALVQRQAWPRKMAPIVCICILLLVECLRQWDEHPTLQRLRGKTISHAVAPVAIIVAVVSLAPLFHLDESEFQRDRRRIVQQLEALPQNDLVVVRYAPDHDPNQEWVYNRADIDAAAIVWAREMSPAQNRELRDYFSDRRAWLLEPDADPARLTPLDELFGR